MTPLRVYEPDLGDREAEAVLDALRSGFVSGSGGAYLERFERVFAEWCGCEYGVAVSSGTAALHVAAAALGVGPGDEVLVSAATNIASALAVAHLGATVVPVDARPDTWCMDTELLPTLTTERTVAVMPVHLYGHPVDMDGVARTGLPVIEDAAEAHGAEWRGRRVGGFGAAGCFSFYANKILTCGEAGMITTNDPAVTAEARKLRDLYFGQPRFLHERMGWNYRLSNLLAALGCAQLERVEEILAAKRRIAEGYTERLQGIPGLRLPVEAEGARNVYWMYALVVEPEFGASRDELMDRLAAQGMETRTMFCPLGRQPALISAGLVRETPCPVADELWDRGLYLPSGPQLTEADLDRVTEAIGLVYQEAAA